MRSFAILLSLFFITTSAHAQGVWGNGAQNYDDRPERGFDSSASRGYVSAYRRGYSKWDGHVLMGMAASQLTTSHIVPGGGTETKVVTSNFQMNLNFSAERRVYGPFGIESGLHLAGQFLATQDQNGLVGSKELHLRYVDIPAIGRVHFSKMISIGLGGFATIPINEGAEKEIHQLGAIDLGFIVSSRLRIPANRTVDWVLGLDIQRGVAKLASEETYPNHVRNYVVTAGLAGKL